MHLGDGQERRGDQTQGEEALAAQLVADSDDGRVVLRGLLQDRSAVGVQQPETSQSAPHSHVRLRGM